MKKTSIRLLASAALLAAAFACKTPTVIDNTYSMTAFPVECMGTDLDGSQTMRVFGTGKNKAQAMETAKKNAVKAVLFEGVTHGTAGCNVRPVIGGANPMEKNEAYFNRFFADGGAYKDFTSMADEKCTSRLKSSDKSIENWGVVVRVNRAALKDRMIADGIIEP